MINVYERVEVNKRKSALVVLGFVVFVAAVAYVFSQALGYGLDMVGIALILSGVMSLRRITGLTRLSCLCLEQERQIEIEILSSIPWLRIWLWRPDYLNRDFM